MELNKYILYAIYLLSAGNLFLIHLSSMYYINYYVSITILIFVLLLALKRNSIRMFFRTKGEDKYIESVAYAMAILVLLPVKVLPVKDMYSNNLILGLAVVLLLGAKSIKRFFKKDIKTVDNKPSDKDVRLKLFNNYGKYTTLVCMFLLVLIVELRLPTSKVYYLSGFVVTIMFLIMAIFQYKIEKVKLKK